jgi:serine/threonine protein kinase
VAIELFCVNPECGAANITFATPSGGSGRCSKCGWAYSPPDAREQDRSTPDAIEPGTIFDGRYRIERLLGEGGMGVVFLATDLKLQRRVAPKILHLHGGGHPDLMKRFHREARIAAGFDHPNLCQVYDFGQAGGVHHRQWLLL